MDTVINWFLLLIIFVFDPLAIALVVAANMAFEKIQKDHTENIPYISDDFQIGPDGAYEHVDDIADEENDIVEEEDVIEINEDLLNLQESIPEDIYEDKPIEDKPKEPINTPTKPPARARAYWA